MRFQIIRRTAAVILAAAALCVYLPVYAEGDTVTTVNHIGTGNVSISLNEFRSDAEGHETPIEGNADRRTVLPGQTVSKISRITVNGHKSWIRAKVMTEGDSSLKTLSPSWVKIFDDDSWLNKGTYWYYTKPVEHGDTVRFTKEVRIPPETDTAGAGFHVVISADAVQYDNFKPDFSKEDPWFGTAIEESAYQTYRSKEEGSTHFYVSYEGGAQGLIANTGDMFQNFRILMPGDKASDSVVIGNGYSQPARLFFRIEGAQDDALAKRVTLKIHAGTTQIFSGTLADAMHEIYLAYMKPQWTAVLTYELEVPDDLKDEFALADTKENWIFRAEVSPSRTIVPNTGDSFSGTGWAFALIVSAAAAVGAAILLKRKTQDRK